MLQYEPVSNSLVCMRSMDHTGASASDPISDWSLPQMFSYTTGTWRRGPNNYANIRAVTDALACYDSNRLCMWQCNHNTGEFAAFTPAGDNGNGTFGSWGPTFDDPGIYSRYSAMGLDPGADRILFFNFRTSSNIYRKDPSNMAAARVTVTQIGAPTMIEGSSLQWVPALGGFVTMQSGTGNVYLVTSANGWTSATWTLLTSNVNGKTFDAGNGLFNKAQVATYGTLVLLFVQLSQSVPTLCMKLQE
jgi:hypothetical protein